MHSHVPPMHCCPARQGLPFPHRHSPVSLQVSASMPQATQAAPATPHVVTPAGRHVSPLQHPSGQPATHPLQMPPGRHIGLAPALQTVHSAPAFPQAVSFVSVMHVPPGPTVVQHPSHDTESQTHESFSQRRPSSHASPSPHWHPFMPQVSALSGSHTSHGFPWSPQDMVMSPSRQVGISEQQPSEHVWPLQTQAPFTH